MDKNRTQSIFVGRKKELDQFRGILSSPQGGAILVIGQEGFGKSKLLNKMSQIAEEHPDYDCRVCKYDVFATDSVESILERILNEAFSISKTKEKTLDFTSRTRSQLIALLNIFNIGSLIDSLFKKKYSSILDQLVLRLKKISKRLPQNAFVFLFIDPEKYLQNESEFIWKRLIQELPNKFKFIFAQRPEDVLASNNDFLALPNVTCIPKGSFIESFNNEEANQIISLRLENIKNINHTELVNKLSLYKGHPYAIQAALDLIEQKVPIEDLPQEPTGIAKSQWKKICSIGSNAITLFESYAILNEWVSDAVIQTLSGLEVNTIKELRANGYIDGLLLEQNKNYRIYHAILSDYIILQIDSMQKQSYYKKLTQIYINQLIVNDAFPFVVIKKVCIFLLGNYKRFGTNFVMFSASKSKRSWPR